MRAKACTMALAALIAAPVALAGELPAGMIAGHLTSSKFDVENRVTDDGVGYGFHGWSTVDGPWLVHGEYQTTPLSRGRDLVSLRLGAGLTGELFWTAKWLLKAEYVDFGADVNEDGFGYHGGVTVAPVPRVGLFATFGKLDLNDTDGYELNAGGHFAINRDFAAVLDYRHYMGEYQALGFTGDFDVTDIRLGVAYTFY